MDASRVLYRDTAERERLLDLGTRLASSQRAAAVGLLIAIAVGLPVYGWPMAVPLLAALVVVGSASHAPIRRRCGDWTVLVAWAFAQVLILTGIAVADGPVIYILCLPIFPMLLAATSFRRETVVGGAVLAMAALVGVTLATAHDQIAAMPPALWVPALLLLVITLAAMAVRDADMVARVGAVADELTGLLNRVALESRVAELTHQVRASRERVALIVVDLDHFKQINDTHGHAVGDAVLVGAARLLSEAAGDLPVYRFGGEEFVILACGTDERGARDLAEGMREALARTPVAEVAVTASFGIAVSSPDDGFEYRREFAQADTALYAAKAQGRDRVCVAGAAAAPVSLSRQDPASRQPADGAGTVPPRDGHEGNWLVRDAIGRAHIADISDRAGILNLVATVLSTIAVISTVPWLGWQVLIPGVTTTVLARLLQGAGVTSPRPEVFLVLRFLLVQVGAALLVIVAGPQGLFLLPMFSLSMYGYAAVVPGRGALMLVLLSSTAMACAALIAGSAEVAANPLILALPLGLGAAMAIVGSGLGARVTDLRVAAISDGLTGTLNRVALDARIAELTQRPAGDAAVGLIVLDLDHFKAINDANGHHVGDQVLAAVAERMRSELRAFDGIYRIGGEEFVVLLAGTDAARAAALAERIRAAVARTPAARVDVTVSLGVAESPAGVSFDYDEVFARADAALLTAKREGRDRVVVAQPGSAVVSPDSDREELLRVLG
ncbi:MAG: GGDEF domain-containing protein [Solirubrobacteraceae bacterium]|nr:GGDEF domain-containing protein [Solirubrobacteraceae bacterium]